MKNMTGCVLASVAAYAGTNIDDIFILMLLLAQAPKAERRRIAVGHCLGVGGITLLSLLGALGLQSLPLQYTGLLGLVPVFLGVRAWLQSGKGGEDAAAPRAVGTIGMAVVTLGNGADNIGVYIPLFAGFSWAQRLCAAAVFAAMTALWLYLGGRLAGLPGVKAAVCRWKHVAVPLVFLALGAYIMVSSGLFG